MRLNKGGSRLCLEKREAEAELMLITGVHMVISIFWFKNYSWSQKNVVIVRIIRAGKCCDFKYHQILSPLTTEEKKKISSHPTLEVVALKVRDHCETSLILITEAGAGSDGGGSEIGGDQPDRAVVPAEPQ